MLEKSSAVSQGAARRFKRGRRQLGVGLVVVALLFSGLALRDLNGLLEGMRAAGGISHTIGSLASVTKSPGDSAEQAKEVLRDWHRYADETPTPLVLPRPVDAHYVAGWQILVDAFVFALAYTAAFLLLFVPVARRERDPTSEDRLGGSAGLVASVGAVVVLVTFAADEVENFAQWQVVDRGWTQLDDPANHDEALSLGSWAHVLWGAAAVKWLSLLLIVVPAAVGLMLLRLRCWRDGEIDLKKADPDADTDARVLGSALWRLRVQIVIVVAMGLLLLGHEQMPDVIRAWSMEQLAFSLVAAVLLMLGTWASGRLLLEMGNKPATDERDREARFLRIAIGLAALSFVLWAIDWLTDFDLGWGWVVLGSGIVIVLLAGLVFGDNVPPPRPTKGIPASSLAGSLPEALSAAVPVVLGLAVFHASFAYTVYLGLWETKTLVLVGAVLVGLLGGVFIDAAAGGPEEEAAAGAEEGKEEKIPPWWAEPVLSGSVGGVIALIVIAFTDDFEELNPSLLVALGVLLGLLGWGYHHALGRHRNRVNHSVAAVAVLGGAAILVLVGFIILKPWQTGAHLGGIAVLLGFLLALSLVGVLLVWLADGRPAPRGLRALGFHHTPIFAFLFVWLLIASAFDEGGYHDVRQLSHGRAIPATTANEAWQCWLEKNGLDGDMRGAECRTKRSGTVASSDSAVPMLFVSTSGGGIRAAYWTAVVLDCALEVEAEGSTPTEPCSQTDRTSDWRRSNAVFAMSGISGGGLGLASYTAFLAEKSGPTNAGWIKERMDADSLTASIAWWLFVEAPRAFLRFNNATDRAEILERGWERDWKTGTAGGDTLGRGLLDLQHEHPELPLLLLNGTSVADGCRFNTSILDINFEAPAASRDAAERCRSTEPFDGPGFPELVPERPAVTGRSTLPATRDFVDFRCRQTADIPLSSAALLAARFPFVSPAGRIAQDCDGHKVSYVVDGGYLETSGASPIIEILGRLLPRIVENNDKPDGRCIVPFFIQIDNGDAGYRNLSARPGELNVPLKTLFASRSGRAANARTHAALLFSQPFSGSTITLPGSTTARDLRDRYAHFNTYAHPGPNPPLGWTLSENSRKDLFAQLGQERNVRAMAEVRSWFAAAQTGGLTCER